MKAMNGKRVKRVLAAIMAVLMIVTMFPETSLRVSADNSGTFKGEVLEAKTESDSNVHKPIKDAHVEVYRNSFSVGGADTDANGKYSVSITAYEPGKQGEYKVVVTAEGYISKINENLFDDAKFYLDANVKEDQAELKWAKTVPEKLTWKNTLDCTVTGGTGDGEVTYKYDNADIVDKIVDGVFYFTKPGKINITAVKAGGDEYNDAKTTTRTVTLDKAPQTTEFKFSKEGTTHETTFETPFENKATGGDTGNIKYSADKTGVVTIDNEGTVTPQKTGNDIKITAFSEGNEKYLAGEEISYNLTIKPGKSTVEFNTKNNIPNLDYKGTYVNTAKAYDNNHEEISNAKITYSVVYRDDEGEVVEKDLGIVEIVDQATGKIKGKKKGTAFIKATFTDDRYEESSAEYEIEVVPIKQTITFDDGKDPVQMSGKNPSTLYSKDLEQRTFHYVAHSDAEADGFKMTPTYTIVSAYNEKGESIVDDNIISKDGTFVFTGAGTVIVNAHFDGNDCYMGWDEQYTLTINKYKQNLVLNENSPVVILNDSSSYNTFSYKIISDSNGKDDVEYKLLEDPNGIVGSFNVANGQVVLKEDIKQGWGSCPCFFLR